ncbi:YgiQ family radical SAM protein [Methanogenium organophilum]|uniref:YgiQ family radical SAM protein n=1 Tax=Methanogenium organophilum TaxID=2199 RepID=A0A9X9S4L9_METOG|nr:YgiQ family radical SAM protein [Methanogenium organophilum]WAI00815.1 YgiQ family radical SAM protein [Methanogenium organophilum]
MAKREKSMFLPTTQKEMKQRKWDQCDVVIVTPDAYIDHPSFAMAVLGRMLESKGYRVGILSQPKWKDPQSFLALGIPKIAFAVSGGAMDSMVMNYTASKIPRKDDAYCENGEPYFSKKGDAKKYRIRPDRTINVYTSQIRSVCREVPIIIGGIEASMRRITHYDWWSDSVRRSILFDSKADILVYGMGEYPMVDCIRELSEGNSPDTMEVLGTAVIRRASEVIPGAVVLPSFADVKENKEAFQKAFTLFYQNRDVEPLVQMHDTRSLVQFPRRLLTSEELDAIYALPFRREPHPRYRDIPAFRMIEHSVTSHRGCYGRCSFCSIAAHQGPEIVSRSKQSILQEVSKIASKKGFSGTITDIGGPSANMYASSCRIGGCREHDCLKDGAGCKNLIPGTRDYLELLSDAADIRRVNHVFISSGLRFDPAIMDDELIRRCIQSYTPGRIKIAPESGSTRVTHLMNKPSPNVFTEFLKRARTISSEEGNPLKITPYIIAGHPGEETAETEETIEFLTKNRLSGNQTQIFTPTPLTRSTAMYYLGYDPLTGEPTPVERNIKNLEERKFKIVTGNITAKKRNEKSIQRNNPTVRNKKSTNLKKYPRKTRKHEG